MHRILRTGAVALLLPVAPGLAAAQQEKLPLPLTNGAAIVEALAFQGGDRESVHHVREAGAGGLRFTWNFIEVHENGDTVKRAHRYFEAAVDVDSARRLKGFHNQSEPEAHPGYTMHAISRSVYRRLRRGEADSFQIMSLAHPAGAAGLAALGLGSRRGVPVRWRGKLTPVGTGTVSFPLLVNQRRLEVPAIRVRGSFTARHGRWEPEFLVLADSTYPLLLRWSGAFGEPGTVLQVTQVNGPGEPDSMLEESLRRECRAELPGVYFAFNSAELNPASDRAIAGIALLLSRHPDWVITIEGHTDSIGSAASNLALSQRRVEAVRRGLVEAHKLDPARLPVAGHGATRPREPNATIEGRARNRRVELVREC
ncbi:MAG TPA: OmpA family protein [Gemmatimonadales bacterium]|nr:OmpA family protein [Gemmatimonadales bacterium]